MPGPGIFLKSGMPLISGVSGDVFRHCVRAFLLFSSTFCVHFYYFPALFSVRISTVFSTVGVHFYYVAALFACISAVFVCVCMCVFVCVCMCCIVCVCMCLYEFVCALLCLYVFVCVCMCFVCVCIFYVLMCLYVFVCMCVYVSEIHQLFFFTSISTVFQHFCLSQLDLPVCTIVQRTCAEKVTCACDLISIAHWSY